MMTSTTTDRRFGVNSGIAIKAPCAVATTANITLSGEQSIDGVTTSEDRVLVKNQTDGTENGIYLSDSGDWTREPDFDGTYDITEGTLVKVNGGTVGSGFWYVSTTGTITIDSTSIAFTQASSTLAVISAYAQTLLDDTDAVTGRQTLLLDASGADIASSSTINLTTSTGDFVDVTGTTTITAITLGDGVEKTVRFTGALTLTHGASLVLPGAANITTAAGDIAVFRGDASSIVRCVDYVKASGAPVLMSPITSSLGSNVALGNTGTYYDGPSVAQGTAGVWFVSGTVTLQDTTGAATFYVKLWDGVASTPIASCAGRTDIINAGVICSLSGYISAPAGNLRISVKDVTSATGNILYNVTSSTRDSTITAIRIA